MNVTIFMNHDNHYRFCPCCSGDLFQKRLKNGEPERLVCSKCNYIFFLDPKVAACVIIEIQNKIVLLKRGIPPQRGKWVIPGGFVDLGEPVTAAAIRETWEEVRLNVKINTLLGVYSYPQKPVVVIVYEASLIEGMLQAADEALDVQLFAPEDIPWKEIAFSSTRDALRDYLKKYYPDMLMKISSHA